MDFRSKYSVLVSEEIEQERKFPLTVLLLLLDITTSFVVSVEKLQTDMAKNGLRWRICLSFLSKRAKRALIKAGYLFHFVMLNCISKDTSSCSILSNGKNQENGIFWQWRKKLESR